MGKTVWRVVAIVMCGGVLAAGCGGGDDAPSDTASEPGPAPDAPDAPAGGAPVDLPDPCSLVTTAELETAFTESLPPDLQGGTFNEPKDEQGSCVWQVQYQEPVPYGVRVAVQVTAAADSPGRLDQPSIRELEIDGAPAILEPVPNDPEEIRDIVVEKDGIDLFVSIARTGGPFIGPEELFIAIAEVAVGRL